ncbi:MAG: hypothetical protein JWN45_2511 [Acidobacteriaceae bacterium]|nr:hypothetical protein [Acidobacteriaceae bacterium]
MWIIETLSRFCSPGRLFFSPAIRFGLTFEAYCPVQLCETSRFGRQLQYMLRAAVRIIFFFCCNGHGSYTVRLRVCSRAPAPHQRRVADSAIGNSRCSLIALGQESSKSQSLGLVPSCPKMRCRNLAPCFLYTSDPARRKASQIRATL